MTLKRKQVLKRDRKADSHTYQLSGMQHPDFNAHPVLIAVSESKTRCGVDHHNTYLTVRVRRTS